MKILYDLRASQPIGKTKYHGGSEYSKQVFRRILELKKNQDIVAFYDNENEIDLDILNMGKLKNVEFIPISNNAELSNLIKEIKPDHFYSALPYKYNNLDIPSEVIFIYTIHGLRSIELPTDLYEFKYLKSLRELFIYIYKNIFTNRYVSKKKKQFRELFNISNNRIIIVPSVHTKYSILSNFNCIKDSDINVLYAPLKDHMMTSKENPIPEHKFEKDSYFLTIGGNRWIKNNYRLLKAFDELFTDYPDIEKSVIIVGVKNNNTYSKLKNKKRFVFLDYVNENLLEELYMNAYSFVYPTLNEGFGYPPLEAMKYGVPVISSAITSLTEIYGDSMLYFNPYSLKEIKTRIMFSLYSDNFLSYKVKSKNKFKEISTIQIRMLDELVKIILKIS